MLEQNETIKLLRQAKSGDEKSKEILIVENLPLVKSIVKRFRGRLDYDDLMQLGIVGFLKAMSNFDENFGVKFSTYAVPMILGEIKRYLRDDGTVKVSRWAKVLTVQIKRYIEECQNSDKEAPTVDELAEKFECDSSDIVFALNTDRYVLSLSDTLEDDGLPLYDKIVGAVSPEMKIDEMMLKDFVSELSERDRKIIILRYFRDETQSEVALKLGVSQVQVSRLEKKILKSLREKIEY